MFLTCATCDDYHFVGCGEFRACSIDVRVDIVVPRFGVSWELHWE